MFFCNNSVVHVPTEATAPGSSVQMNMTRTQPLVCRREAPVCLFVCVSMPTWLHPVCLAPTEYGIKNESWSEQFVCGTFYEQAAIWVHQNYEGLWLVTSCDFQRAWTGMQCVCRICFTICCFAAFASGSGTNDQRSVKHGVENVGLFMAFVHVFTLNVVVSYSNGASAKWLTANCNLFELNIYHI